MGTMLDSHLPAFQSISSAERAGFSPLATDEIDPSCFDLVASPETPQREYSIEARPEQIMSAEHLKIILKI